MKLRILVIIWLFSLLGCSDTSSEINTQTSPSIPPVETQIASEPLLKISDIARKTPAELEKQFGFPTSTEIVNPSSTPCPCDKNAYRDGEIEVVFMNGKADWITVNLPANKIDTSGSYLSISQFDQPVYTYVKVSTK